jgi:hypothetical protein
MTKEGRDFLRGSRADIVRLGAEGTDRQLSKTSSKQYPLTGQ